MRSGRCCISPSSPAPTWCCSTRFTYIAEKGWQDKAFISASTKDFDKAYFPIDELLLCACGELRARGVRFGGVIQRSSGERGQCASSVHVVDLRSGAAFDIWEARGACARGCRLDERGLVDAEAILLAAIAERVDLLVINRFGRAESLGRGLIGCFAAAIEAAIPVLAAVRAPYDDAWREFHGGLGQDLHAEVSQAVGWAMRAAGRLAAPSLEAPGAASR